MHQPQRHTWFNKSRHLWRTKVFLVMTMFLAHWPCSTLRFPRLHLLSARSPPMPSRGWFQLASAGNAQCRAPCCSRDVQNKVTPPWRFQAVCSLGIKQFDVGGMTLCLAVDMALVVHQLPVTRSRDGGTSPRNVLTHRVHIIDHFSWNSCLHAEMHRPCDTLAFATTRSFSENLWQTCTPAGGPTAFTTTWRKRYWYICI